MLVFEGCLYMSRIEQVDISKDIVKEYYEAMRYANEYFDDPMKEFIKKYPLEFRRLNAVHHKRVLINSNVEAMKTLKSVLYFGCLTYDNKKDRNKIECKRKEAFAYLNSLFEFVLLVEEYGEENGRYHVHFVGNFKENKTFNDFVNGWHSRQNLRVLRENEKISQYLCKYLSKQLPRIRRNKKLIQLERAYHKHKRLKRTFPTLFEDLMNKNIFQISIFDLE